MMSETMIERVADAIMRADDGNPAYREIYLRSARAAIEAMREPTPEMIEAGIYARDNHATLGDNMAASFAAMIDAALTPPKSA